MIRRRLSAAVIVLLCLSTIAAGRPLPTRADHQSKPNIVVFYIDDMTPNDGRLWSDPNLTPNIYDLFVAHGIHFANAIGETPLCCPSRATFLTGLHSHNTGVTLNDASLFNPGETVAKELQKSGYDTMIVGKYLNKVYPFTPEQWVPYEAGWSSMDVFQNDQRLYPERYYYHYDIRQIGGTITHYDEPHSTRFITETAVARLQQAPVDAPVFLDLTPYSTHNPDIPMPEFIGDPRCANMPPWDPPSYNEADISDKPLYVQKHAVNMPAAGYPLVQFCESMLGVDWMVGQIVAELTAERRMDNTLFIFTADNGMTWGEHRLPLNKDTPYATPIPLYMRWPARWGSDPREINEYVSDIDFAPTFCDAGVCTLGPFPTGQSKPDGVSLLPLLDGTVSDLGRDALLQENWEVPWSGLRTTPENPLGLWHYVEWANGDRELYDMTNDPWELTNVASDPANHDLIAQLHSRLLELLAEGRPPGEGSLTIVEDSTPNNPQDFQFSGDVGSFSLDDDSNATLPRKKLITGLAPGDYTITQAKAPGWTLTGISCPLPTDVDVASGTVTVHLLSSDAVKCTFKNLRRQPDLSIAQVSSGPFKGDNVYSATPLKKQTQSRDPVTPGQEYDYFVNVQNDGKANDAFTLKADVTGTSSMSATFWAGSTDVTAAVMDGSYATTTLAPGATTSLLVRVVVAPDTLAGAKQVILVHASSVAEPVAVDVVRAITID